MRGAQTIAREVRSSLRSMGSTPEPIDVELVDRSLIEILAENDDAGPSRMESSSS